MTNPSSTPTSSTTPTTTSIRPNELPPTVRGFLDAHAARDLDAAGKAFTADAVVTDQDETFRGTEEVVQFLRESGSEFTYTTELVGAERSGRQWVATVHLEGDFPGGVVDLQYRFTVDAGLISELRIGI